MSEAQISASLVKELRDKTGAGMMDCKKALQESDGDLEKAGEYLRKQGILKAAKKSGQAREEIDVDAAASIFVGMIQSSVVFWALSDFSYSLKVRQAPLWREYRRIIS